MIDFDKELKAILEDDPLGLLAGKPKVSSVMSANDRLVATFTEINDFVRQYNREPAKGRDINERRLFSRLQGLRENPEKTATLSDYDSFGLLADVAVCEPEKIYTVDDVFKDDPLGLLADGENGEGDPNDIFNLTHVQKNVDQPDFIAKRKQCKEFEQLEPLFKRMHVGLASKEKVLRPFTSEKQIKPGEFFILQGMMVYVGSVGDKELTGDGKVNARLYCVFENGTESNMLLRSLAAALWKDENSSQVIEAVQFELFEEEENKRISSEDEATGYIYVLRSLSADPRVMGRDNLFKIGFSCQSVGQRIRNAAQDPTYLMADVLVVTEFETFNLDPHKLEHLLHSFFAQACLNIDVCDGLGKRHSPREWFDVPLRIIEVAVQLLISGEIVYYRYEHLRQEILMRGEK